MIYTNVSLESARAIIEKHDGVERTKEVEIKVVSFREQTERYKRSGLDRSEGESHLKRLIEYMEAQKQVRKTTTAHGCCGSVFSV